MCAKSPETLELSLGTVHVKEIMKRVEDAELIHTTGDSFNGGSQTYHVNKSAVVIHESAPGNEDSSAWRGYSRLHIHGKEAECKQLKETLETISKSLGYSWP